MALFAVTADNDTPVILEPLVVTTPHSQQPLVVSLDPKAPAQPVPAHDGADVLKGVPGFSVIRKGGADGDPVLRGMAGSRLGVQIDGELIFGGCGNRMDPPTAYVFPAAYDRVTIIKGPQTVMHGAGHSAGLVLFERDYRRYEHREKSLFASLMHGGFQRFDAALDARAGNPTLHARIALTHSEAGNYRDGDGRVIHSEYHRWSANASVAWTPDDRTHLEFSTARSDGEAAYADRGMDGTRFARENHGLRLRRDRLTPIVQNLEAHVYHNYVDHVMDNYSLRTVAPTLTNSGASVSNPDRLTYGGRFQLDITPRESTKSTTGVDFQINDRTVRSTSNQNTTPFATRPRVRDAKFAQVGVFGELSESLGERQRLLAGARVDYWEATDHRTAVSLGMSGTLPNPTANLTRETILGSGFVRFEHDWADRPTTFFAGLGHTARFPDYWELFRNETATTTSSFLSAPERTSQLDTGVIHRTKTVEFSLSIFASRIDDFLLVESGFTKPSGMTGTRTAVLTRNVRSATLGGEASIGWRLTERWKLDASVAAVRGENKTDSRPLAQMPPLEGRLALAYTAPKWSVGALLRSVAAQNRVAIRQGNIVGQDLGTSPGFAVLSCHGSWQPVPTVRISAGIDNALDRTYAEHISRAGAVVSGFVQTTRVNEPGRFAWLKLDLRY